MSAQGIDFPRLTLCDALDLAILIEQEAEERYYELANQMILHHTTEAASFFTFMAHNEAKHGASLAQRRQQLFGDAERAIGRSHLWDVEAPEFDQVRAFMTPREAMLAALASEQKAYAFFVHTMRLINDPDTKRLFEELREEEVVHQSMVRSELDKLPPDPIGRGDEFEDEPNSL